jgi:hypothetical protein
MIRKRLEKRSEIPTDTGREVTVYTLTGSQAGANLVFAALPAAVETMLGIAVLLDRIDHADSRATAIAMVDRA